MQSQNVKLIAFTQPSEDFRLHIGADANLQEIIAYCARVSNPSNQMNISTSERLIKYLIDHKHFSPLEMVSITLEISTTRDIARQILRHRSFSFQEFSQRYAVVSPNEEFIIREARLQDAKNRQNSIEIEDDQLQKEWREKQLEVTRIANGTYQWALDKGIAKEQARVVLPEGLTVSKLYMHGTMRSFLHYLEVRTDKSVQKEHRILAKEMYKVIKTIFPMIEKYISD